MGFDASTAVEPLDWDFSDYLGDEATGRIPEPTSDQVETLFNAMREIAVAVGIRAGSTQAEVIEAFSQMPAEDQKRQADHTIDALVEFCQGEPSREQIEALPYRVRNAFLGWIVGQFAGDAGKGVTQPSRATANGAVPAT